MAASIISEPVDTAAPGALLSPAGFLSTEENVSRPSTTSAPTDLPEPVGESVASVVEPDEHRPAATTTPSLFEELRESLRTSTSGRTRASALDEALASLKPLLAAGDVEDAEWVRAARLLRSAAIERRLSSPRVASVALLLSDALFFTEVGTIALADRTPLKTGFRMLLQSFVSTEDERSIFRELLEHRWYVTPAFDPETFATAAGA